VIRWLEDNPVGRVLAAIAGVLVVLALLLGVVWSLPPSGSGGGEGDSADEALMPDVPQLPASEPIERYAVVTERPVFNESRQPELEMDLAEDGGGDAPEEEVDAPEVELAGVIITPTLRMVTLRQKEPAGESLVAFEGQPLQGDYGTWHVSRIAPREITLASGAGEELQLKLEVHDAKIAPPPKPKPPPEEPAAEQQAAAAEGDGADAAPLSRAEEIRQRIQERREELRRAAEEEAAGGQGQAADYRKAIQSMISGRKDQPKNEEER
jgi:hypothetical protein